eukprot:3350096-Pleurochrysis_carterae.AAC.1
MPLLRLPFSTTSSFGPRACGDIFKKQTVITHAQRALLDALHRALHREALSSVMASPKRDLAFRDLRAEPRYGKRHVGVRCPASASRVSLFLPT